MNDEKHKQKRREQSRKSAANAYRANPEKFRAKSAKRRKENPERSREIAARSRAKRKASGHKPSAHKMRQYHIKWKYGMSSDEHDRLFEKQGCACAACGTTEPLTKNKWHIDHDHKTGKVRGVLCHPCNTAAGVAGDDPVRLRAIADYLESSSR